MTDFDRRAFLALGTSLLLANAKAEANAPAKLSPPAPAVSLPELWLQAARISLWPGEAPGIAGYERQANEKNPAAVFIQDVASPELHVFPAQRPNGHALLVMPGGAYRFVSVANEGAEVAARMNQDGFTVFVLTYRLPGEGWDRRSDVPLQDAQRAMRVIRARAASFKVDPSKVSVLGFSAGGHLAATLATQHAERSYAAVDAADRISARPFAAGLVYPVVTMATPWTHEESRARLLGPTPSAAQVVRRSIERQVGASTPPVFAVHALDDPAVPVENTLHLIDAMRAAKRPIEAHLLQEGGHAFGLGFANTPSSLWPQAFNLWLKRLG